MIQTASRYSYGNGMGHVQESHLSTMVAYSYCVDRPLWDEGVTIQGNMIHQPPPEFHGLRYARDGSSVYRSPPGLPIVPEQRFRAPRTAIQHHFHSQRSELLTPTREPHNNYQPAYAGHHHRIPDVVNPDFLRVLLGWPHGETPPASPRGPGSPRRPGGFGGPVQLPNRIAHGFVTGPAHRNRSRSR